MRSFAFAVFALAGLAVLLGLGIWQVQRLDWKTAILNRIDTRIAADPVALPRSVTEEKDEYLPVRVSGQTGDGALRVLITTPEYGASYRVIAPLETDGGRRILIDLGAIPAFRDDTVPPGQDITVTGNLLWPNEVDGFTPEPDLDENIWFARDLPAMADALDAEPLLVVTREAAVDGVLPLPITSAGVPNDHLQYAVTWFSLAAIWAGMTVLLLWRMAKRQS